MAQVQSLVGEDPHKLQVVPEKKKKKKYQRMSPVTMKENEAEF